MNRLTVNDLNRTCYDPWELCGMDSYCTKDCHEEGGCTKGCEILKMYKKLAHYEDLEEQGLLMKLPCKIGDTVYSLDRFCGGYSLDCPSRPCKEYSDYQLEIYEGKFQLKDIYDFGKSVFLTQVECEEALKRMESGE